MSTVFSLSSWLVLPFWLAMIAAPRWRWTRRVMRSPLVPFAPALVYLALAAPRLATLFPAVASPTLDGIAAALGTPEGATLAWAHFLAFDLFVGRWVYLEALERGIPWLVAAPALFLTLMLGPVGYLLHLGARARFGGAPAGGGEATDGRRPVAAAVRGAAGAVRSAADAIRRGSPLLARVAAAHALLLAVFLLLMPFDARTVTGIDPWIKPAKFAASIAIYTATVAWLLGLLEMARSRRRFVERSLAGAMVVEIALIAAQAARGTTSHFNQSTALDAAVFGVMGAAITFATLVAAYVTWLFFRQRPAVPRAVLLAIRAGLVLFLVASLEGYVMVAAGAHTVGAADGGPGLPFVNWSTAYGDLRIAHFAGMHAIQALPLAGYALWRLEGAGYVSNAERWLGAVAALYGVASALVFALALAGRPLLAL